MFAAENIDDDELADDVEIDPNEGVEDEDFEDEDEDEDDDSSDEDDEVSE
jgi:hypothetical protein